MGKIIGVLGGMGPQASSKLYELINGIVVEKINGACNQDFPHLLISNLPVPDLIDDKDSEKKTVFLAKSEAERLDEAGASDLFMPCNTMHLFGAEITKNIKCNFHPIVDLVIDEIKKLNLKRVLILGTNTTIKSKLYQKSFFSNKIEYVEPTSDLQSQTVEIILSTIAGKIENSVLNNFEKNIFLEAKESNVDAILLACTELPLIIKKPIGGYATISSLEVMAEKIFDISIAPS